MDIEQRIIPISHPNRPGLALESMKAVVMHYTANEAPTADAIANAKYFGRPWALGWTFDRKNKTIKNVPVEVWSIGPKVADKFSDEEIEFLRSKGVDPLRVGTEFGYGSTQFIVDMNRKVQCIPINEVANSVGDRPNVWTPELKGQLPLAKHLFNNRQNYRSLSIEICNNDVLAKSDADWKAAVENAKQVASWIFLRLGKKLNFEVTKDQSYLSHLTEDQAILLMHNHITGKICPRPFIEDPAQWEDFIKDVNDRVLKERVD